MAVDTGTATGQLFRNRHDDFGMGMGCQGGRTREPLAYKRRNGERIGAVPYRYNLDTDGKHIMPDPAESQVVARIVRGRNRGEDLGLQAGSMRT
jgi:hypothetical protein